MSSNVSNTIKNLREISGMTQTDLAEKIGVTKSMISAYEKGIRNPSFKVLYQLCDIFQVPESLFFDDKTLSEKFVVDITDLTKQQQNIIVSLLNEFKDHNEKK